MANLGGLKAGRCRLQTSQVNTHPTSLLSARFCSCLLRYVMTNLFIDCRMYAYGMQARSLSWLGLVSAAVVLLLPGVTPQPGWQVPSKVACMRFVTLTMVIVMLLVQFHGFLPSQQLETWCLLWTQFSNKHS
jgi:hypothetical protein